MVVTIASTIGATFSNYDLTLAGLVRLIWDDCGNLVGGREILTALISASLNN
jgi:hypothetical protein